MRASPCGLIHDIQPAALIVRDLMREAEEVLKRMTQGVRARTSQGLQAQRPPV